MRLVLRGVAGYGEIRQFWDIVEVIEANELLDIQDDVDWHASDKMQKEAKTGR